MWLLEILRLAVVITTRAISPTSHHLANIHKEPAWPQHFNVLRTISQISMGRAPILHVNCETEILNCSCFFQKASQTWDPVCVNGPLKQLHFDKCFFLGEVILGPDGQSDFYSYCGKNRNCLPHYREAMCEQQLSVCYHMLPSA